MNFLCKLLLWSCLCLLLATRVQAQEAAPWRGIMCDTQAQIEGVVTKGTELGGAWQGIQAVNLKAGTDACIYGTVIGVKGPPVKTIDAPEGPLDVIPFIILGVVTAEGIVPSKVPTWFTLGENTARGA